MKWQSLKMWADMLKLRARMLLTDENGEVNIVTIVVLIGIAVLLALTFKGKIQELLNGLFNTIGISANKALNETH